MASFSNTFNTNCTLPTTPYHYVTSANFRSTTDILWSSWSALVLFTWTIQHLNLPALREERTWREKCGNLIREVLLKVLFMLATLLAPEILAGKALVDWISARTSREEMDGFAVKDNVEWTVTHAFYANMGGFVVQFSSDTPLPAEIQVDHPKVDTTASSSEVDGPQARESLCLESAKTRAPVTSSSNSAEEKVALEHFLPQLVPRGQKFNIDIDQPHKLMSGEKCPCSPFKNDSEYARMSIEDIRAHRYTIQLCGLVLRERNPIFFNGGFLVRTWMFPDCSEHPNEESQASVAGTINDGIAGQALYEAARNPDSPEYNSNSRRIQAGLNRLRGRFWTLSARQLCLARKLGIIETLPDVSEKALKDQSKGDAIIKLAAVFQGFYITLQLILRRIEDLLSSLLELQVVAFAACAFITYLLFFSKPQDVHVPRYIKAARYPTPKDMAIMASSASYEWPSYVITRRQTYAKANLTIDYCNWSKLPSSVLNCTGEVAGPKMLVIGSAFAGVLFGAIHCAAWFSSFPTPVEKFLWRLSCFLIIFLPLPPLVGVASIGPRRGLFGRRIGSSIRNSKTWSRVTDFLGSYGSSVTALFWGWFSFLGGVAYVLARLFLFCEVFRQLFFLPPEAFRETSWLVSFPHVG